MRFDRLVDGELTAEEYRSLLAALETSRAAGGSCALAFLESQALARRAGRRAADARPASDCRISRLPARQPWWPQLRTLLAMAASFALAFGLGVALPQNLATPTARRPARRQLSRAGRIAGRRAMASNASDPRHTAYRPIGNVQLVVNGDEREEQSAGEVPVYEIGQNLEEYLQESQPGLDPYVLYWLQQQGHEVEVQQQLISGQLEDGRPMYVPVEQYTITPVKQSYWSGLVRGQGYRGESE